MTSKKDLLKRSHLYAVVDKDLSADRILKITKQTLLAGADIIQLRDKSGSVREVLKTAKALKRIAKKYNVPFIINDRLDVAVAIDADGLHVGQGDIDIVLARKLMGKGKLIGVSATNIEEAKKAKLRGADYLGIGPIFATPIKDTAKPKGLKLPHGIKKLNTPFFSIGGIDCKNIYKLTKSGFKNVAVIRAICTVKNPYIATRRLKAALV